MGKTIGFTYDTKEGHGLKIKEDQGLNRETFDDALAEFDVEETIEIIRKAIESGGHRVVRIGHVRNLLERLPNLGVDIVFNLCEGLGSRNRESEVPVILDLYKVPYIGSDGLTLGLTLDKVMAKKAFICDGIPTPKYFIATDGNGSLSRNSMRFPFIVKPRHEGSSKGISDESIVANKKLLRAQVSRIFETYHQPALVEEFVPGYEFTVLVIGNEEPQALPPVQIQILGRLDLGDLIYTSRRLLTPDVEYICPAKISKRLEKTMCRLAMRAYQAVDCRDFGRVDFRVDDKGNPYVLEVNPLPSLSTEDVFPLIAKASGMTYEGLILEIIEIALQRCGLYKEVKRRKI